MTPSRGLSGRKSSEVKSSTDYWQLFRAGDFGEKWNSSKLIVKEGKRAIAPLLKILEDPTADAETHWFTIRTLGNFPEPQVIAAIAAQIGPNPQYSQRTAEQTTELSNFAIETLAAMGPPAIEVLTQLLNAPPQRLLAAKALNQIRSTGVIPAMIAIAEDEDAKVRYYAIDALGSFHNPLITPVLIKAIKDPSASVRKATVMALGRRPDLQTTFDLSQKLEPLLWDIDISVCCQTALALGRLGAGDMVSTLQQVLLSDNTPKVLCLDIIRALAWYCEIPTLSNPTSQQAYSTLSQALRHFSAIENSLITLTEERQQILVAIVRVFGELNHSSMANAAIQCLIDFLQVPPDSLPVIQATIMALADLAQPQAFEPLLPFLNHREEAVPMHTIAALKRLDPDHSFERVKKYLNGFPDRETEILDLW
ncbi:MAG: HEAT repeat domain-containing protein [Cyanobacteria bacterium P01_D01_bin.156]